MTGNVLAHGLSPFYADARRMLRLAPSIVDELLELGAFASISAGDVIFTAADDGRVLMFAKVRVLGRRRAASWVNRFNARARS